MYQCTGGVIARRARGNSKAANYQRFCCFHRVEQESVDFRIFVLILLTFVERTDVLVAKRNLFTIPVARLTDMSLRS